MLAGGMFSVLTPDGDPDGDPIVSNTFVLSMLLSVGQISS